MVNIYLFLHVGHACIIETIDVSERYWPKKLQRQYFFFSQFSSQNQIKTKQKGIFDFSHVIFPLTFIFLRVYGVKNPFIRTQQGDCCCIE